jgi:hypothetical protein
MPIWAKNCIKRVKGGGWVETNDYSYAAPPWNRGLDKYYRDFCAGKVGQDIKVSIKLVGGREYDSTMPYKAGTIRSIQKKLGFDV